MSDFIGRKNELNLLKRYFKKKSASLLVVRGRRRIGKSRLIEEFAKEHTFYSFTGLPPSLETTAQEQRDEFAHQLGQAIGIPGIKSEDWNTLFLLLAKQVQKNKVVILLDEISWIGSKDHHFLAKLKNAWDLHFKKNNRLVMILCGSASSWIEKNILSGTGFVGRISYTLTLEELPLRDCALFWPTNKSISAYEKLKLLAVTGGIPKYLEEIDPKLNAEENIRRLCFTQGGFLVHEFEHLFSTLFLRHSDMYRKIIMTLASGTKEINEVCQILNIQQTGRMSEYFDELVLAGFIRRDYTWHLKSGLDSKLSKYRLSDNYLRFYLKYINKYKAKIDRNSFDVKSLTSLPGWDTVMGLQFENLVLNNRAYLWDQLHINKADIISENPFFQHKTHRASGCQIDYMIHTKHSCLYLIEIKFSRNQVGSNIIKEVQKKIDVISKPKGVSYRPVLIHVNGVSIDVEDHDFFAEIIDFSKAIDV